MQAVNTVQTEAPRKRVEIPTEHPHVVRVETEFGNKLYLRGSRIQIWLLAQFYRQGDSAEDIIKTYPHLNPAAVYDGLSYFLDHKEEIVQEIIENRADVVLAKMDAHLDERGFVVFKSTTAHESTT
ncbi:MAG: DUF433 domain-containing protein [Chloroflexi bacterium]|nr:DUF433 domain-containing protein [Chloroflexota bacterium]